MTKRQKIEAALSERYRFRYNVITSTIEFTEKDKQNWRHHTDYDMNSIIRKIDSECGETVSPAMYSSIIASNFSPQFHPVRDYFNIHLSGKTAQEGFIVALSDTVKMKDQQQQFAFRISLKRWLVASVANAMESLGCQNHTCLVFTGGMGKFKTTWLNNLCPPFLRPDYLFTGKIDLSPGNKDVLNLMVTKFITNLDDQLRNLMKKDSETMKTFITQPEVTIRRPYQRFDQTLPRLTNYCASINGDEFMAERENRRFLPFQVIDIDINTAQGIDMDMVWLEALSLYKSEYKYWWSREELDEAFPNMDDFAFATDELEMILSYYEIPDESQSKKANVWMSSTEIMAHFRNIKGIVLSSRKIGEALASMGAKQDSIRTGKVVSKKWALHDPNQSEAISERDEKNLPF